MTLIDFTNFISGLKYGRVSGKPREVSFCFRGNIIKNPKIYIYETIDDENESSICIGILE